jgi:hypothetical protein
VGGATIVYRTRNLRDAASWRYDGLLCVGDGDTGVMLSQQRSSSYSTAGLCTCSRKCVAYDGLLCVGDGGTGVMLSQQGHSSYSTVGLCTCSRKCAA